MARTKKPVMWTVLYRTGHLMGLTLTFGDQSVLPLFSTPTRAEEFVLRMNLSGYFVSPPHYPHQLKELLLYAIDAGFDDYVLDPPVSTSVPVEVAEIDDLLDQVEERLGA
jgi:hypothetical protein